MSTTTVVRHSVLADAFLGRRTLLKDAFLVVGGTAVTAALAQVSVPLWPVPITGQTLAVVIVGAVLGARRGAAALALYLLAGLAGAPIFAEFGGGPAALSSPSFGFIIGFIPTAWLVGLIAEKRHDRRFWSALFAYAAASLVPFIFGLPYLALSLHRIGLDASPSAVLAAGFTPFVVGGAIKALIASALVPLGWRLVARIDSGSKR